MEGKTRMNRISRPLTMAIAVIGAGILVPSAALAATSLSATAQQTAAAAPACVNANPALPDGAFVWATLPSDGFTGGVGYIMEITNEGHSACTVRGVPGAALQESNGHLVGGPILASSNGPLITLKPGATAHFSLIIHDAGAVCAHPVSGEVEIYLPGQKHAQDGQIAAQGCAGLRGGGVLSPGVIEPSTGIPLYSD
jgi:hypothetical protein